MVFLTIQGKFQSAFIRDEVLLWYLQTCLICTKNLGNQKILKASGLY